MQAASSFARALSGSAQTLTQTHARTGCFVLAHSHTHTCIYTHVHMHTHTHTHTRARTQRREFGEVLECVTKAGRVAAVTSADKAKAVNEQKPGFWELRKVL